MEYLTEQDVCKNLRRAGRCSALTRQLSALHTLALDVLLQAGQRQRAGRLRDAARILEDVFDGSNEQVSENKRILGRCR